jgi:hypothetical protein
LLALCSVRLSSSPLSSEEADFRTPQQRGSFFSGRLKRTKFVDLGGEAVTCRAAGCADRGIARRLLVGHQSAPAVVLPDVAAVDAPGRVSSLGRFHDAAISAALSVALPDRLLAALRSDFEWYGCRGACFHNDAHFGGVLFGAWCIAGPPRQIVFARSGIRVAAGPGDWVVFDPFEPHGVLDEGADCYERNRYLGAPVSIFIGFELTLGAAVTAEFGIGAPAADAPVLASGIAVNSETGALRCS